MLAESGRCESEPAALSPPDRSHQTDRTGFAEFNRTRNFSFNDDLWSYDGSRTHATLYVNLREYHRASRPLGAVITPCNVRSRIEKCNAHDLQKGGPSTRLSRLSGVGDCCRLGKKITVNRATSAAACRCRKRSRRSHGAVLPPVDGTDASRADQCSRWRAISTRHTSLGGVHTRACLGEVAAAGEIPHHRKCSCFDQRSIVG